MEKEELKSRNLIKGYLQSLVNSGKTAEEKMEKWWTTWPWNLPHYRHVRKEGRAAQRLLEELSLSEVSSRE